jgi:hypothetical protein
MRDLNNFREVVSRESRRALGTSPYSPRTTVGGTTGTFMLPELLALPVDFTDQTDLMDAALEQVFMFDMSAFDGPNPWA